MTTPIMTTPITTPATTTNTAAARIANMAALATQLQNRAAGIDCTDALTHMICQDINAYSRNQFAAPFSELTAQQKSGGWGLEVEHIVVFFPTFQSLSAGAAYTLQMWQPLCARTNVQPPMALCLNKVFQIQGKRLLDLGLRLWESSCLI
eukprot:scaffold106194_cov19-Tisochrysis_lutea.AAC.2